MPLQNVYLDQDAPNVVLSDIERKALWNKAKIIHEAMNTDVAQEKIANEMAQFVTEFIDSKWIDPIAKKPKDELGLMFTINKRVLMEILDQLDCEGIRIYISTNNTLGVTKTSMVIKPVDSQLEELDKVRPDALIKFSKTLTECPPETRCPSNTFDTFKVALKLKLDNI